jgi:hypothetical protein
MARSRRRRAPADTLPQCQPWRWAAWWDDDPPVLLHQLRQLGDVELGRDLELLPGLLQLQEGWPAHAFSQWVRRFVIDTLLRRGEPSHLAAALRLLDEPRTPFVVEWLARLLDRLEPARRQETARWIASQPETAAFRWARANLAALLADGPFSLNLRPVHRRSRSRLSSPASEATARPRRLPVAPPAGPRPLGATGLTVSPLGISGRYGLPVRGFHEAIAAGVNLFLWEPTYRTQTRCWRNLPPSVQERLHVLAGTFAADARTIRQDAEQALQALGIERLGIFVLFWVRSAGRLHEEALEALDELRSSGKVRTVGLSTHLRDLACDAIADGWPVLMVRHSLAQRRGGAAAASGGRGGDGRDRLHQSLLRPAPARAGWRPDRAAAGRLLPLLAESARRQRLPVGPARRAAAPAELAGAAAADTRCRVAGGPAALGRRRLPRPPRLRELGARRVMTGLTKRSRVR